MLEGPDCKHDLETGDTQRGSGAATADARTLP
jgi:hypothetical protein